MNFHASLQGAAQSFKHYCYDAQQAGMSVVLELKKFRNNPSFFLKTSQLGESIISLLAIAKYPSAGSLARFKFVLSTIDLHNFYNILKRPRPQFFPITADAIDENVTLNSLTPIIHKFMNENPNISSRIPASTVNLNAEIDEEDEEEIDDQSDSSSKVSKEQCEAIARSCLRAQLEKMREKDKAYRNVDEFKKALDDRLSSPEFIKKLQPKDLIIDKTHLNSLKSISLKDLKIRLNHTPFLEKLENWTWLVVDIECVAAQLQTWKVLDTAKWASRIGQYSAFQWVKSQNLVGHLLGAVVTGCVLKLVESVRRLRDDALTQEERTHARWNVITSLADVIFYGVSSLNHSWKLGVGESYIQCLAIISRTLGLIQIATTPRHEYFQPNVAAAA